MSLILKWAIAIICGILAPLVCKWFGVHVTGATLAYIVGAVVIAMMAIYADVKQAGKSWWKSKHVVAAVLMALAQMLLNGFHVTLSPEVQAEILAGYGMILAFFHITWDQATVPGATAKTSPTPIVISGFTPTEKDAHPPKSAEPEGQLEEQPSSTKPDPKVEPPPYDLITEGEKLDKENLLLFSEHDEGNGFTRETGLIL